MFISSYIPENDGSYYRYSCKKITKTRIGCSTPSNVLPFYVTAETGAAECPGFAALSTLLNGIGLIHQNRSEH